MVDNNMGDKSTDDIEAYLDQILGALWPVLRKQKQVHCAGHKVKRLVQLMGRLVSPAVQAAVDVRRLIVPWAGLEVGLDM